MFNEENNVLINPAIRMRLANIFFQRCASSPQVSRHGAASRGKTFSPMLRRVTRPMLSRTSVGATSNCSLGKPIE